MHVIYTSKGVMKMLGFALYIRCALSLEKYGNKTIIKIEKDLCAQEKKQEIL
jgi:hypothetical protein